MKTEMQRQLEALGFEAPKSNIQSNKARKHNTKSNNEASLSSKAKVFQRRRTKVAPKITEDEAKIIVKRLYKNPEHWADREFAMAIRRLTGQSSIMCIDKAKEIVNKWHNMESRIYQKEYSIALLMLSGIWVPPKKKLKEGMSKQIVARCERRDINSSYKSSWVFKN